MERQVATQRVRLNTLLEALQQLAKPSSAEGEAKRGLDVGGSGGIDNKEDEHGEALQAMMLAKVLTAGEDLNQLVTIQCKTRQSWYLQVFGGGLLAGERSLWH